MKAKNLQSFLLFDLRDFLDLRMLPLYTPVRWSYHRLSQSCPLKLLSFGVRGLSSEDQPVGPRC